MKKASHIYRWALRKQRAVAGRSGSSKKGSMGLLGASGTQSLFELQPEEVKRIQGLLKGRPENVEEKR